ncbi:MAG: serine (or cysteine) proteinase inhibitor, cladeB (ovalbumin), er [Myxococcaceae bacterium]|nr:serine (or cysteine) proteinase inhibitor, cladeB (ovalbumin), er [Myxococcaceae bacterium]
MKDNDRAQLPPLIVGSAPNTVTPPPVEYTLDAFTSEEIVSGINNLGTSLWQTFRRDGVGLLISPAGIALALGMAKAGALNDTQAELRGVLRASLREPAHSRGMGALGKRWHRAAGGFALRTAVRLYGDSRFAVDPRFLGVISQEFGAPMDRADFTRPEAARAQINGWVGARTDGRVADYLPPEEITEKTRMVLVNAMCLASHWGVPSGRVVAREWWGQPVQTVSGVVTMGYLSRDGYSVLEVPHGDGDVVIDVILPDREGLLPDVELRVMNDGLSGFFDALTPTRVEVSLPRLRLDFALGLYAPLSSLGMREAFNRWWADFTAIAPALPPNDRLSLSDVFHRSVVDVAEVAAATASRDDARPGGGTADAVFDASRPFLIVVRDTSSGAILFLGRVLHPLGVPAWPPPAPDVLTRS